jgi:Zn-dependent protease
VAKLSKKEKQGLVLKLAQWQKPFLLQIVAILLFALLARIPLGDWSLSLALIISMILHELGHGIVYQKNEVEVDLLIIFPLGAVAKPANQQENAKSDTLPLYELSWLVLAGPVISTALVVIGKVLAVYGAYDFVVNFGKYLAVLNTFLVIFNLLPIWVLDAGQLANITLTSLDEESYRKTSTLLSSLILAAVLSLIFVSPNVSGFWGIAGNIAVRFVPLLFVMVSVFSIAMRKRKMDRHDEFFTGRKMDYHQVITVLIVYFSLLAIVLLVS